MRRQYCHAVDIVPTLLEALGHRDAGRRQRLHPAPAGGRELHRDVRRRRRHDARRRPSSTRCSARGRSGTTAGRRRRRSRPRPESWGDFHQQRWELFDTTSDAERVPRPQRAAPREAPGADRALVGRGGQLRGAAARVARRRRDPHDRAPAAQQAAHALRLLSRAGPSVPESVAPNIRNRSYTIARRDARSRRRRPAGSSSRRARASAGTPSTSPTAGSSTSTTGSASSCRSSSPTAPIPTGHVVLSASFEREGDGDADARAR